MDTSLKQLMAEALRLTRAGDLRGATATIQAALSGSAAATRSAEAQNDSRIIEGEAREVASEAATLRQPVAAAGDRNAGQFIAGNYADDGGARDYKLYVPADGGGAAPALVVMLHGCTQNPDDFAAGTGMNDVAREQNFFVLYPAQAPNANASRCWNWFDPNHQLRGRGEPALLANMTRDVMTRYNIDPLRVYVAGLSAGGAMAAILGDAYPDLFAAVGVHSGLPTGAASDVQSAFAVMKRGAAVTRSTGRTPPTIVFHGDQDTTVAPLNGERVATASAGAAVPRTEPGIEPGIEPAIELKPGAAGRAFTRRIYRDASNRVTTEHWLVHGAGHAWSGGTTRGSYTDPQGPNASREMVRFFFANAT